MYTIVIISASQQAKTFSKANTNSIKLFVTYKGGTFTVTSYEKT